MEEKIELLEEWYKRIRNAQRGHYKDAEGLKRNKKLLGLPTVILSTLVGTSVFASLADSSSTGGMYIHPIIIGMLSLLAAIFASLQTFLNYSEKSEKHLNAARKLSSLKKEIQQNLITLERTPENLNEFIIYIRKKWDEIINEAPLISRNNFSKFFENKKKPKK
ncbi:SLATT domain-containing protein [Aquimarina sp. 2201CG5-10]|uniref:SLATT domain-containing protein n=1 Tax=Aquimarina callyspongiae TaxID=3098150 RepID=UPI002AB55A98|nr:SLATT domain-containing protein [Aquimarina sp. 2201CG5-10]MDY8135695.1 SLATT domain-containing protein [Aquimarina sp. 2201CG5-10]